MNRKIMLLPLAAALVFGLASCESTGGDTSSSVVVSSSVEEEFDGGISDIQATDTDVTVAGVVAQKGTKGWVLDDGKASVYVYGALDDATAKVGDVVNVAATFTGYYGLYELKSATVTKRTDGKAPKLSDPVEIDGTTLTTAWNTLSTAASGDATWAPTNSKRYKITGLTAESVSGYAGWSVSGFKKKIVPYYYNSDYNVTEANRNTKLYAGCKYDVSFYIVGTNSSDNVNMGIFDVTAHYDAVESVTVTGDTEVEVGSSVTLTAAVTPSTADQGVTWTSSNTEVATVSSGKVTAVKEGSVTITAASSADSTKKAEYTVTVKAPTINYEKVADLSFNKDTTVTIDNQMSAETDPHMSYTSTSGLTLEVRQGTYSPSGTAAAVNVWANTFSSARIYGGNIMTFKCETAFSRIVLTCDSGYSAMGTGYEGMTVEVNDTVVTITLDAATKSVDVKNLNSKQIRPNNVEVQKVA